MYIPVTAGSASEQNRPFDFRQKLEKMCTTYVCDKHRISAKLQACERALILIKIHPAQIYYNSTDFFASQLHYTAHIAFVTVSI